MADPTGRTFRGVVEDKPLTPAERRAVIEAPWPTINIWNSGKSWGGTTKREHLVPDSPSWERGSAEDTE